MKALEQGLYAALSGDSTLAGLAPGGVWRDNAPIGTTGTFVVYQQVSGIDDYTLKIRATTSYTYMVKAVAAGESSAPALDAAERIDAVLTDQPLTLSAGSVLAIRRDTHIIYAENDGGERYHHAGGHFRIMTQEQ